MRITIGVDEVGHGSIAGPLVVSAVAFDHGARCPVLKRVKRKDILVRDSKKIPVKLLPQMAELVKAHCLDYMVVERTAWEIDKYGVHKAHDEALRASVTRLLERIAHTDPGIYDNYRVIIDGDIKVGSRTNPCPFHYRAQAGADDDVWQVSAASILAKHCQVERMIALHEQDSRYHWDKNKGYATKAHLEALEAHGVTRFHRKSYRPVQRVLEA